MHGTLFLSCRQKRPTSIWIWAKVCHGFFWKNQSGAGAPMPVSLKLERYWKYVCTNDIVLLQGEKSETLVLPSSCTLLRQLAGLSWNSLRMIWWEKKKKSYYGTMWIWWCLAARKAAGCLKKVGTYSLNWSLISLRAKDKHSSHHWSSSW